MALGLCPGARQRPAPPRGEAEPRALAPCPSGRSRCRRQRRKCRILRPILVVKTPRKGSPRRSQRVRRVRGPATPGFGPGSFHPGFDAPSRALGEDWLAPGQTLGERSGVGARGPHGVDAARPDTAAPPGRAPAGASPASGWSSWAAGLGPCRACAWAAPPVAPGGSLGSANTLHEEAEPVAGSPKAGPRRFWGARPQRDPRSVSLSGRASEGMNRRREN